jgi:hypothetical protein
MSQNVKLCLPKESKEAKPPAKSASPLTAQAGASKPWLKTILSPRLHLDPARTGRRIHVSVACKQTDNDDPQTPHSY